MTAIGARPLKRLVQRAVLDPLAVRVLNGEVREGSADRVDWDGTGFPKHLKNVNIPLGARIIAVADYYDTAIYSSPDFSEKTKAEVTREIFSGSSILFDPEVIAAFIKVLFHKTDLK